MNYHNQPEQAINKRVAEILGYEIIGVNVTRGHEYASHEVCDDDNCIFSFNPITDWRDTGLVIEKLRGMGNIQIESGALRYWQQLRGVGIRLHKSTEPLQKALCIILCEVCENTKTDFQPALPYGVYD